MERKQWPPLALGTWSWGVGAVGGDEVFGNYLGERELAAVFDAAMEAGLTLWDTAVVYGMGASEQILGALARPYPRRSVQLSTKFTPQIAAGGPDPVAAMCEASLERLGVDAIDLYWIHNPADVERWTPLLAPLVHSGKVKAVGVSNHNLAQIERAEAILAREGVALSAVQNHYSLLYRASEQAGILAHCAQRGMAFFAYMVLEQGALSGSYDAAHLMPQGSQRGATYNPLFPKLEGLLEALRRIGTQHGVGPAQVAVAWAIAKGTVPLIGVTRVRHVQEAAAAAALSLTAAEITELEALAAAAQVDTRGSWERPMAE